VTRQRKWGVVSPKIVPPLSSFEMGFSPERDFFRSGPDLASQTPDSGPAPAIDISPSDHLDDNPQDPPGTSKGGGFKW
jgi:hypothetical protein